MLERSFAERLISWQKLKGRHGLPWQVKDPYRVWVSEIMLQQTQVATVLEYYVRFLERFPSLDVLARASLDDVLQCWSGLGYYSRARNLHLAAQRIIDEFGGIFPQERQNIERLPGIGRSTAAAIAAFVFDKKEAILDGNVKRVLTRLFAIDGFPGNKKVENQLWDLAESLLPDRDIANYTQGLMDLGAMVCLRGQRALCRECPFLDQCIAARDGRVAELPISRPRKAIATRYTVMVLATYQDKIWLVQRPPAGIWGGLWSFPECDKRTAGVEEWLASYGEGEILPVWRDREHVFSHFRLIITPQPVRLRVLNAPPVNEQKGQWLPLAAACNMGVPAPVKKMLKALFAQGEGRVE